MKGKTQETQQQKKRERDSAKGLKFFLIFLVAGNVFFFSSNMLFRGSNASGVQLTEYDKDMNWNDRVMRLARWEYDEKRAQMEVEIGIESNESLDGVKSYEYSSNEYNAGALKVTAVVETSDMLIVRIKDVPKKYTLVSLHVNVPDGDKKKDLVFYENHESITASAIEDKTMEEYAADKVDRKITAVKADIKDARDDIKQEQKIISNGAIRIQELQSGTDYQTEEEKQKTQSQIAGIESKMESSEKKIEELEGKIQEYERQIEVDTQLLAEKYGKGKADE